MKDVFQDRSGMTLSVNVYKYCQNSHSYTPVLTLFVESLLMDTGECLFDFY